MAENDKAKIATDLMTKMDIACRKDEDCMRKGTLLLARCLLNNYAILSLFLFYIIVNFHVHVNACTSTNRHLIAHIMLVINIHNLVYNL